MDPDAEGFSAVLFLCSGMGTDTVFDVPEADTIWLYGATSLQEHCCR